MITEDIDISWKLQLRHWDIFFEPRALCWILMPETLKGLWKQRLRWAQAIDPLRPFDKPNDRRELPNLNAADQRGSGADPRIAGDRPDVRIMDQRRDQRIPRPGWSRR